MRRTQTFGRLAYGRLAYGRLAYGRLALAALLCLSLGVWSVAPSASHAPSVLQVLQDHAGMVATHGHSHGLEEDLYWALHGHTHDVVDHDHSEAMQAHDVGPAAAAGHGVARDLPPARAGPALSVRIDRPPRA